MEFYRNDLVEILFSENYFSYKENADSYVLNLKNEIENYIDIKIQYESPKFFLKYGKSYIIVSLTNRTSWYVFF